MVPLPRWIWISGICLSAVAGMVNAICYMGMSHQVVSHLTGSTSLLGLSLANGDLPTLGFVWGVLIAFCLGATISGLVIQDSALQLGRRYGVVLMFEAILIAASVPLFERGSVWGVWIAAMACGLQNAMATTYSGALLRTTHLTGMFTDLGIGLGHLMRGVPLQMRRLTLSGLVISGFLTGSFAGAVLFRALGYSALFVPAGIVGLAGAGYLVYCHGRRVVERRAGTLR